MKAGLKAYLVTFIISLNFLSYCAFSQDRSKLESAVTENELRVIFIYNFTKYVEWENMDDIEEFKIGILGKDLITNVFNSLAASKKVNGKPIRILNFKSVEDIRKVQILYVNKKYQYDLSKVLDKMYGNNTLLVSANYPFNQSMINLIIIDNKMNFEVNEGIIERERLKVSPGLIKLAIKSSSTWEDLFNQVEKSLEEEKKVVKLQKDEIIKQQNEITKQIEAIKRQSQEIKEQQNEIVIQKKEITEQKSRLFDLVKEIDVQQKILAEKIKVLSEKEIEIKNQHQKISDQQGRMALQTNILGEQQKNITHQKNLMQDQKDKINKQLAQLEAQKVIMYLFIAVMIISLMAIFLFYRSYRIKKEANRKLEEKNVAISAQNVEIESQKKIVEQKNKVLEKLSIVASETDNSVIIMDARGNLEWANDGFTKLLGYTFEEFRKEKGTNLKKISGNPEIEKLLNEIVSERKSVIYEAPSKTKNGKEIWLQTTLTPIFKEDGSLKRLVAIESDITVRKNAEDEIIKQKEVVEKKSHELSIALDDIIKSIAYAQKIQRAILPHDSYIKKHIKNSFVLYKPKDIVSGDFYWFNHIDNKSIIAAVDCTGHGVPGAFMSMIGHSLLNSIVIENRITQPAEILNNLKHGIIGVLKQSGKIGEAQDGMDIALCSIDSKAGTLEYAGAYNPLFIYRKKDLIEIKPDKQPVGISYKKTDESFTNHEVSLKKDDTVYMFSDGFIDQFGGNYNKRYMTRRFKELLEEIHTLEMEEQHKILEATIEKWQGEFEQIDDITVIGFRI